MDQFSKRHFYIRSRFEELHGTTLRNESSRLTGDVGRLNDGVFVHMPAVFAESEPELYFDEHDQKGSAIPSTEKKTDRGQDLT